MFNPRGPLNIFFTKDECFVFSPGRPGEFNRIFGKYRQEEVNIDSKTKR